MLLLDNTVLSNFALVNQADLLTKALGEQAATTSQVIKEFENGVSKGILPTINWDWLTIIELNKAEAPLYEQYLKRVNEGEASCLAVASNRNGSILTDDRDARKIAAQLKVPVSGTIGVLVRLTTLQILTIAEADQILEEMISKGYRSPITSLNEL